MKIKNILGAAIVAVAGINAGQIAQAEPTPQKNKIESQVKAEEDVHKLDTLGKSLFHEHKYALNKIGVDALEILSTQDAQKLIGGTVSANGMTTITIKFMKNGVKIPGYQVTVMTMTSGIKNKFDLRELLNSNITAMTRKGTHQTANSRSGVAINATGNASVSVNGSGNKNIVVESFGDKGRVVVDGKDVTPEGTGSGPMRLETINGVLHINGKLVKK